MTDNDNFYSIYFSQNMSRSVQMRQEAWEVNPSTAYIGNEMAV